MNRIMTAEHQEMPVDTHDTVSAINGATKALLHIAMEPNASYSGTELNSLLVRPQGENPVWVPSPTYARGMAIATPLQAETIEATGSPRSFSLDSERGVKVARPASAILVTVADLFGVDTTTIAGESNGSSDDRLSAVEVTWRIWEELANMDDDTTFTPSDFIDYLDISPSSAGDTFRRFRSAGFMDTEIKPPIRSALAQYTKLGDNEVNESLIVNEMDAVVAQVVKELDYEVFDAHTVAKRLGFSSSGLVTRIADSLERIKTHAKLNTVYEEQHYIDEHRVTTRGAAAAVAMRGFYQAATDPSDSQRENGNFLASMIIEDEDAVKRVIDRHVHHTRDSEGHRPHEDKVLKLIDQSANGVTTSMAAEVLEVSSKVAHRLLHKLMSNGQVSKRKVGRNNFWLPSVTSTELA